MTPELRTRSMRRSRAACSAAVRSQISSVRRGAPGWASNSSMAAIGDISRFGSPRQLVAYLGLDPKVRQSGDEPARHGRISKRGNAQARSVLVEAAWVTIRQPGPLCAFGERIRARKGAQVAAVAVARKLACLSWQLLTKGEDYAFAQAIPCALKVAPPRTRRRRRCAADTPRRPANLRECSRENGRARTHRARRGRLPVADRRLEGDRTSENGHRRDTWARTFKAV